MEFPAGQLFPEIFSSVVPAAPSILGAQLFVGREAGCEAEADDVLRRRRIGIAAVPHLPAFRTRRACLRVTSSWQGYARSQ